MTTSVPAVLSSIGSDAVDRQIDRIFDEALRAFGTSDQAWAPACNAWEDESGFYVQIALPGWEPNEIALEVNNQVLTIRGERQEVSRESDRYHLREIGGDRFVRQFSLPTFVDHDKASATQKNGMLTVTFPKREEAKSRRILIEG